MFTLPHSLNALYGAHPRWVIDTLFACTAQTLAEFAANPKWMGATNGTPAFSLVLHTWAQDLQRHIHVHAVMACGVPQGGPLSPVLANVVLDELDWKLQTQGHRFARYADDCNIFVKSQRAGQRVMRNVTRYLRNTLRLTVNVNKSAVDRPKNLKFLGFTVSRNGARIKVADKAIEKLKDTIRALTRRTRGHRLVDIVQELKTALTGWKAYFGIAEVLSPLREIDKWVRRRIRCYTWKQWGSAGYRELRKRGVTVREAWNTSKSAHGPWRLSKTPALNLALPAKLFRQMGLPELAPVKAA